MKKSAMNMIPILMTNYQKQTNMIKNNKKKKNKKKKVIQNQPVIIREVIIIIVEILNKQQLKIVLIKQIKKNHQNKGKKNIFL